MKNLKGLAHRYWVSAALAVATAPGAFGAATAWTGSSASSANWTDGGNWSAGVPSGLGGGTDITFGGILRNTINDDASNGGTYGTGAYHNIFFSSSAGNFVINQGSSSILGMSGHLTNSSPNPQRINVPMQLIAGSLGSNHNVAIVAGGSLFISGAVSENSGGTNGLIKTGPGTLTLSAANTYSGGTTILEGSLDTQHSGALGAGNVHVAAGASLTLESIDSVDPAADLLLADATTIVNLAFVGSSPIHQLSLDGGSTFQTAGDWGSPTSGAHYTDSRFTGTGILSVQSPIKLLIQPAGTNLVLSWPSASGLSLFSASNLTAVTDWQPVTNLAVLSGALNFVTLPNRSIEEYFQLREAVDPGTMSHKLLMGYQGWFGAPGDGSQNNRWFHWFRNQTPASTNVTVDFLPDLSEFDADELVPTLMTYSNGQPFKLYSAYNQKTVLRHFQWMQDNHLDGIFLQRFVSELSSSSLLAFRDHVTANARLGAESYGRVFAIMYDISGQPTNTLVGALTNDWVHLTAGLQVTQSPRYLRHNSKPVVAIWGFGFSGRSDTPQQAQQVISYFKSAGCTVMGGLPTYWRTLNNDAQTNAAWAAVFRSFDIISPWSVGRYGDNAGADSFRTSLIVPDLAVAANAGREYLPVVFPGFSWTNLNAGPFNQIPRNAGGFYWRQVYNAIRSGCTMIYGAMFDEVDEGTAMYKLAPSRAELPAVGAFVPLNVDGTNLPSDWYLRLADQASKMLRGRIPLQAQPPISP